MRIKIGDLVKPNSDNSHLSDVGIVIDIFKERRKPTMIKIHWQANNVISPWLRPGIFQRLRQDLNPDGGRAP